MQTANLKSKDVKISTYSADGRGAVSAALKKRSQSAPLRRNVTVQVLDQDRSQTPRGQSDPACPLGDPGTSTNVAAITAAVIAAAAPLIKAQSEMEAQIALVTAELRRLQAAESSVQPGKVASTENSSAGRAAHLEEQLKILIQQRLQHLETVQCQQIQLQSQRLCSETIEQVDVKAPWRPLHHVKSFLNPPAGHNQQAPSNLRNPPSGTKEMADFRTRALIIGGHLRDVPCSLLG